MATTDLAAWRKQNSDPVTIDMVLSDGSEMRAIVLVPREKTLKDVFNVDDTFLEVECIERGPIIFQRDALRSVRPAALPKAQQLEKRLAAIEKLQPRQALGVPKNADTDMIAAAADRLLELYDPERARAAAMPAEVIEFMTAMCRRVDAARNELAGVLPNGQAPAA